MRFASFLLVLGVAACSGKKESFLTVFDPCEPISLQPTEADEQQQASVRDAVDMWNAVASTQLSIEGEGRPLPIVFEESYLFLGFYDDAAEVIRLATRVNEQRPRAVVLAHELGHAFNLFHVDDRDSVMNEGNWEIAPLGSDAAALEAVWGPCVHR